MLRRFGYFSPLLFGVFPVLALAADNARSAPIGQVLRSSLVCLAGAAVLWGLFRLLIGDWARAAAMTSVAWVVVFTYGHLHSLSDEFPVFRNRTLLPAALLLLAAAFFLLRRMRREPARLGQALALMSGVLVLVSTVRIASYRWQSRAGAPAVVETRESSEGRIAARGDLPDVYYIILDGHASAETLRDLYGFDETPFLDGLRARGFYVAERSRSNYAQTPLSLASSTNMEYIPGEIQVEGLRTRDAEPLYRMIEDSRVMRAFKDRGYKFVNFQSGWTVTAKNRHADWDVDCGGWEEFNRALAQTTLLEAFRVFQPVEEQSRDRILCQFATLEEIPRRIPGPRYVFAHFVSPEGSLLFGRNGEPVARRPLADDWADKAGYVEQLAFVDRRITAAIDRILAASPRRPVIVVQADHGSASEGYTWMYQPAGEPITGREKGLDPFLRERMSILNAYLLPGGNEGLYASISPVNSFRVIRNRYFGEKYPLLEDRSFFSRYSQPYALLDVTDRVKAPAPER